MNQVKSDESITDLLEVLDNENDFSSYYQELLPLETKYSSIDVGFLIKNKDTWLNIPQSKNDQDTSIISIESEKANLDNAWLFDQPDSKRYFSRHLVFNVRSARNTVRGKKSYTKKVEASKSSFSRNYCPSCCGRPASCNIEIKPECPYQRKKSKSSLDILLQVPKCPDCVKPNDSFFDIDLIGTALTLPWRTQLDVDKGAKDNCSCLLEYDVESCFSNKQLKNETYKELTWKCSQCFHVIKLPPLPHKVANKFDFPFHNDEICNVNKTPCISLLPSETKQGALGYETCKCDKDNQQYMQIHIAPTEQLPTKKTPSKSKLKDKKSVNKSVGEDVCTAMEANLPCSLGKKYSIGLGNDYTVTLVTNIGTEKINMEEKTETKQALKNTKSSESKHKKALHLNEKNSNNKTESQTLDNFGKTKGCCGCNRNIFEKNVRVVTCGNQAAETDKSDMRNVICTNRYIVPECVSHTVAATPTVVRSTKIVCPVPSCTEICSGPLPVKVSATCKGVCSGVYVPSKISIAPLTCKETCVVEKPCLSQTAIQRVSSCQTTCAKPPPTPCPGSPSCTKDPKAEAKSVKSFKKIRKPIPLPVRCEEPCPPVIPWCCFDEDSPCCCCPPCSCESSPPLLCAENALQKRWKGCKSRPCVKVNRDSCIPDEQLRCLLPRSPCTAMKTCPPPINSCVSYELCVIESTYTIHNKIRKTDLQNATAIIVPRKSKETITEVCGAFSNARKKCASSTNTECIPKTKVVVTPVTIKKTLSLRDCYSSPMCLDKEISCEIFGESRVITIPPLCPGKLATNESLGSFNLFLIVDQSKSKNICSATKSKSTCSDDLPAVICLRVDKNNKCCETEILKIKDVKDEGFQMAVRLNETFDQAKCCHIKPPCEPKPSCTPSYTCASKSPVFYPPCKSATQTETRADCIRKPKQVQYRNFQTPCSTFPCLPCRPCISSSAACQVSCQDIPCALRCSETLSWSPCKQQYPTSPCSPYPCSPSPACVHSFTSSRQISCTSFQISSNILNSSSVTSTQEKHNFPDDKFKTVCPTRMSEMPSFSIVSCTASINSERIRNRANNISPNAKDTKKKKFIKYQNSRFGKDAEIELGSPFEYNETKKSLNLDKDDYMKLTEALNCFMGCKPK